MRIAVVLHRGGTSEVTGTALALIERLLAKGHRVSVFAHDEAAALSAGDGPAARVVATLLRRGAHGAGLDWVVEGSGERGEATSVLPRSGSQPPGVMSGDHADLWAFVCGADIVLTPTTGG